MKMKLLGLFLAGLMVIGVSAQAAVLSLTGGGTPGVLPSNFNPGGFPGFAEVVPGSSVTTVFTNADSGSGLTLGGGPATLKFEYLGKEAGFTNTFGLGGPAIFSTATSLVGDTQTALFGTGLVGFLFNTIDNGNSAQNGGAMSAGVSIAFAALNDGSFLALFNDGGGHDQDFDDMVVRVSVSAVPLPAAAWLLLSAVLGLVSFSRIRRNGPQNA
jgi:hypothetical protein